MTDLALGDIERDTASTGPYVTLQFPRWPRSVARPRIGGRIIPPAVRSSPHGCGGVTTKRTRLSYRESVPSGRKAFRNT
jgi:hypothetical protein